MIVTISVLNSNKLIFEHSLRMFPKVPSKVRNNLKFDVQFLKTRRVLKRVDFYFNQFHPSPKINPNLNQLFLDFEPSRQIQIFLS